MAAREHYAQELLVHTINLASAQEDLPIIFTHEDCKRVSYLHQDALIVKLIIANYQVRRILIDEGISADIIFLNVLRNDHQSDKA